MFILIRLFKEKENADMFDIEYDKKFGEPTTEVLGIQDAIDFLDDVIAFGSFTNIDEDINDNYNLLVDRVVMTSLFEKIIKQLKRKNKVDVLKEIKETIIKLGKYEIKGNKSNHPLKDSEGHLDLHIDSGNLILLYKYFNEDVFEIDVDKKSYQRVLKAQDVVDHKQLKRYNKKNYKKPVKDLDIDSIYSEEGEEDDNKH